MSYIVIAEIKKTKGLKGVVSCILHTDFPDRFFDLETVTIIDRRDNIIRSLEIEEFKFVKAFIEIKFANVNSIEDAEDLVGYLIAVDENEAVELEDDEYFYHDLIGIDVYDHKLSKIGTIINCYPISSNDVIDIKLNSGKEIALPFTNNFIKDVNIKENKIVLHEYDTLIAK